MRPTPDIVLASTSRYRRDLLARLGLPFRAVAPLCDEAALKAEAALASPEVLAERLARAKAESLREAEPGALIIGSDQIAALEDRILDKPGTIDRAIEQLMLLQGRTHVLVTAVAVVSQVSVLHHLDVTRLRMRALTRTEVERYVAVDAPLDCAGSYKIEQRGIALFERIESADHSAITGLPLIALTSMLVSLGVPIP